MNSEKAHDFQIPFKWIKCQDAHHGRRIVRNIYRTILYHLFWFNYEARELIILSPLLMVSTI